jgi:hypothetical protein
LLLPGRRLPGRPMEKLPASQETLVYIALTPYGVKHFLSFEEEPEKSRVSKSRITFSLDRFVNRFFFEEGVLLCFRLNCIKAARFAAV